MDIPLLVRRGDCEDCGSLFSHSLVTHTNPFSQQFVCIFMVYHGKNWVTMGQIVF